MEVKVTQANFKKEVLESKVPVVVDFYATWCGPCRMLAPVLAEVAEEVGESAKICKIDIDENPDLAEEYGIESVPTLLRFDGGVITNWLTGFVPKEEVLALLD
ncbi:MAG: thioredoxin [Clostridia bacterium]|nr:thioredoxin [Clostridia bacterium]